MIEAKKYSLPQKEYLKIVFRSHIKKKWWVYLLAIIACILNTYLYVSRLKFEFLIWTIACLLIPIMSYIKLYLFAYSKDSKQFLTERQLFFNSEKLRVIDTDGSMDELPYSRITKVSAQPNYWLLYLNSFSFIYIPKEIFYSDEDLQMFKNYINQ